MLCDLQVELLGQFRVTVRGQPVTTITTPRQQALLAYLLLHRQTPIPRLTLESLFWPDTLDAQSRTNLRNLLHQLRQALPAVDTLFQLDQPWLTWVPGATCEFDVEAFEQHLTQRPGHPGGRTGLEQAVALYRGDLLPTCYADWIQPHRERLRRAYLTALETLAAQQEEARDYAAARTLARRLAEADPFHAAAHLQWMRLSALLGDRPGALKIYQQYAFRLQQELAIAPEPELTELHERLRTAPPPSAALPPAPPLPLIGRQPEWRQFLAHWRSAAAGQVQILFIRGEAGIGKTRLVEEAARWARQQGVPTATAAGYAAEGRLPYGPLIHWLRALPRPQLDPLWLTEIGRLLPEAAPSLTALRSAPEAGQRPLLFEALVRALLPNDHQPRLLILEDCHWGDQDTLEWLHYALRAAPQTQGLIVATEQPGEVTADHPLAALQAALRVEGRYQELVLSALNPAETGELAAQSSADGGLPPLSPDSLSALHRITEGNPLYIVEMLRLGKGLTEAHLPGPAVLAESERIRAILDRRLGRLSPAGLRVARTAAVIGREFGLNVLPAAAGLDEDALAHGLDELLRTRIVRPLTSDQYDFTHDQLRQALLRAMNPGQRRQLHRQVAEALAQTPDLPARLPAAEIAAHLEQAGQPYPAIGYYRRAAETAGQLSQGEALRYRQQALRVADSLPPGSANPLPSAEYVELLVELGERLQLNGRFQEAQARFEQALAHADPPAGLQRSRLLRKLSDALVPQYQHSLALAALNSALAALPTPAGAATEAERAEWIAIHLARSQVYYWSNDPERQEAVIQIVQTQVETAGTPAQHLQLLTQRIMARARRERFRLSAETVDLSGQRLEQAAALDEPLELAIAQFQHGFVLLWHNQAAAALEWLTQGYTNCVRLGNALWQVRSLAYCTVARRQLEQAEALPAENERLIELAHTLNEPDYHGIGLANRGWLAWRSQAWDEAEHACLAARADWERFGGNVFHGLADWILLAVAVARQQPRAAARWAQALLDPNPAYQPLGEPQAAALNQGWLSYQQQDEAGSLAGFQQALDLARAAHDL